MAYVGWYHNLGGRKGKWLRVEFGGRVLIFTESEVKEAEKRAAKYLKKTRIV